MTLFQSTAADNPLRQPDRADTDPAQIALSLAAPVAIGHFDELRGSAGLHEAQPGLSKPWSRFFAELGADGFRDLNRREEAMQNQLRDNGVSYNVYADTAGPQRPWALDLFPLIITPDSWRQIEAGVLQRMRLLDGVLADVYGPNELVKSGLIPPALVSGHPGYLRAMHGVPAVGGSHLHVAAFDLARGPDGKWWVVSQRTQAPSGLGYLLENRLAISRLFPKAFESMQVQRLASSYRALIDALKAMSPAGDDSHIALLTPGPHNETYFEHAYLARYLGLTLVQGNDLTVRDRRVYLRTLRGLEPVHGLLKRVDDDYLDPLELRPDSTLGVPGLLQAVRAGNVLVANAPGSGFLESSAMLGFLPALAEHLLGEKLALPALATWWCGERAALDAALPQLADCVIKSTYSGSVPHARFYSVLGRLLSAREIDEWAERIAKAGDLHTVQGYLPLSQMPSWNAGRIQPRSMLLRVFAVADGPQSWRVLPGGLTRLASTNAEIASMQRGGSSADTWVLVDAARGDLVDRTTLLQPHPSPTALSQRRHTVTSRAAESLFWLGRYTERTENAIRLARLTLDRINSETLSAHLQDWLSEMAVKNTLVLPDVPTVTQARRVFERALIANLGSADQATSVGYNLRAMKASAFAVRERLSHEHWAVINKAEADLTRRCALFADRGDWAAVDAIRVLDDASGHLAAITGAQTDRMTRDDGWRLLSIGRHIERLCFLVPALEVAFSTHAVRDDDGFEAIVALFDSTITFRSRYQQTRDVAALLDLLVMDPDNPRSIAWVVRTLRGRLAKLAGSPQGALDELALQVPDPAQWQLAQLCATEESGEQDHLLKLLGECQASVWQVSDAISLRYFTHTDEAGQSLGA